MLGCTEMTRISRTIPAQFRNDTAQCLEPTELPNREVPRARIARHFTNRPRFLSRVSDLEKRSGIIFRGPSDSRGRLSKRAKESKFCSPKFVALFRFSDLAKRSGIIFGSPFDSRRIVCRNAQKTVFWDAPGFTKDLSHLHVLRK